MSYEIPKNLKYEEKIFFNLSLMQAGWLGLFGVIAFIIVIRTTLPFEVKAVAAVLLVGTGAGFAFFNLKEYATSFAKFFFKPKQFGHLDKEMKQFIEVNKISDDTVYLSNGKAKAIIQVQPINFNILSQKQQQAIIAAYKDFLNSLDFPVQVVMRTVNLSLDEYLRHLEVKVKKSKNEKLFKQFSDFQTFVTNYIEEHAVKNRLFYIVIPAEKSKANDVLNQLEIRVTLCQEKLKSCNLSTKRLSTNELVSMLSSYFEGFIENGVEYQTMLTVLEQNKKEVAE
jgi:hypothetical protein